MFPLQLKKIIYIDADQASAPFFGLHRAVQLVKATPPHANE